MNLLPTFALPGASRRGRRTRTVRPVALKRTVLVRAKARKCVLYGGIALLSIVVGFNVAGDLRHPEWWDPPYGLRERLLEEAIRKQPEKPLLLFLGTSRSSDGLCSEKFDRMPSLLAFNFGCANALPIHLLATLKRLLQRGIRPDYVMVELMPASLCDSRTPDGLLTASRLRLNEISFIEDHLANPSLYKADWLVGRIDALSSARFGLMNGMGKWATDDAARITYAQHRPTHPLGWYEMKFEILGTAFQTAQTKVVRDAYRPALTAMTLCEDPKRCMEEVIALCRQENIPVALYIMPESGMFRSWYGAQSLALVESFMKDIAERFQIRVFDFRKECEDGDFVDGHHLWAHRAPEVTQKLMDRYVLPWVEEQKPKP